MAVTETAEWIIEPRTERHFLCQIIILCFSTTAFFVNCLFLLFLDKQTISRRTKNIIGSYVLASILKAATAASDAGRQVAIGTRTLHATPLSCLFQSPYLIMLIFTTTYAVLAQLIVSVHSLVSAVWVHTPHSTRERINDYLFLSSVVVGISEVVVGVTWTILREQPEIAPKCTFFQVLPAAFSIFHMAAVAVVSYSSILIYFSAVFIMRINWSARKRIRNLRLLHILAHELESLNRLMPIYVLSIVQDIIPLPCRILWAVGIISDEFLDYYWLIISMQLSWYPIIYFMFLKEAVILSIIKRFTGRLSSLLQLVITA